MKVILSRKGFDSQYGGYPSPILPDGRMISLPIPSSDNHTYNDLIIDNDFSCFDLMSAINGKIRINNKWEDLNKETTCHLDPDINKAILKRSKSWRPLFGQINSSQQHLNNLGVKEDDIFLFFGTFREVDDKYNFKDKPEIHAIYVYFQIGEITKVINNSLIPEWIKYHPHTNPRRLKGNNTIYIARKYLSWRPDIPGANVFNFNNKSVLTKDGYSKSKWSLPINFKGLNISYHSANSWKDDYFQSASRGQEFVIQDNKIAEEWAKDIIESQFSS